VKHFLTFAFIPLILSMGIIPVLPFSEAVEYDQICIDKVWMENNKGKIACVTQSTSDKLIERGWGTILSAEDFPDTSITKKQTGEIKLPEYPDEPDVNPGLLAHNKNLGAIKDEISYENFPEVVKVTEQVYVAIGFGMGNSVMVIGDDGLIIIDTSDSYDVGKKIMAEFRKISDLPVKAIVYSHHHLDHVYGTKAFVEDSDEDYKIYAHSNFMKRFNEENGEFANITALRALYWTGGPLPKEGPDRVINNGISVLLDSHGVGGFLPPTVTFDDRLEVDAAGLKMVLIYSKSETSNEIVAWFPELGVLQGGEVLYKLWPNLFSIRGTQYRDVKAWVDSLETMRELQADHLVLSHTYPVSGKENVNDVLLTYHDGVQYIYDQTIRGINKNMTPDELSRSIKLPESLLTSPSSDWLQERYGEREWHIKGIYSGNIGWYDNDVMNLHPISFVEKSTKIVDGFGGVEKTLLKVREAIQNDEYEWALELVTYVMHADPDNEEAKLLKAFASRVLGHRSPTATSRNMYLTTALELEGKITLDQSVFAINDPNQVKVTSMKDLLKSLPTHLDPLKADGINRVVSLDFTDTDEQYTVHIRNSIAVIKDKSPDTFDVHLSMTSDTMRNAIIGEQTIKQLIDNGDIEVQGDIEDFIQVFEMFDPALT